MIKKLSILFCFCFVFVFGTLADWNPDQPFKWVQFPDLETTGIDVNGTYPYKLADDFDCTVTGPLTDFHIWCSWLDDWYGADPHFVDFIIEIYDDIPASQSTTGYSMPGTILWNYYFPAGSFVAIPWQTGILEGWMDPPDWYIFPADFTCWQYNFFLDPDNTFIQKGSPDNPVVYWIAVQAIPWEPTYWGWKSSIDHWNDDAVWTDGVQIWQELRYPFDHPFAGHSIDLAFVVTGEEQTDEKLKFQQAPLNGAPVEGYLYWGHDELSTAYRVEDIPNMFEGCYMADDFADLENTPVIRIKWWGSYLENEIVEQPVRFLIAFEKDVPAETGVDPPWSHPGEVIQTQFVILNTAGGPLNPGEYSETYIGPGGPPCNEALFEYEAVLQNPFPQEPDTVYWIKIVALIEDPAVWGRIMQAMQSDPVYPGPLCEFLNLPYSEQFMWGLQIPVTRWGWHNRDYTRMDPYASTPPAVNPGEHRAGVLQDGTSVWHFQDNAVSGDVYIDELAPEMPWVDQPYWTEEYYKYFWQLCPDVTIQGVDGPPEIELFSKDLAFELWTTTTEPKDLDFGDAPEFDPTGLPTSYPTTLLNDGARHVIVPGIFLGNLVDPEPDGQPTILADGDDLDVLYPSMGDDEDGVVFTSMLIPGQPATVDVTASVAGWLYAWLDFNGDGSWAEAGDQIFNAQALNAGLNNLTFNVPNTATVGIKTYARFRYVTTAIAALSYNGLASDGDVEDYEVGIEPVHIKWSQPPQLNPDSPFPNCFWGWDEISIYQPQIYPICWAYRYQCYGDVDGDNDIDNDDFNAFLAVFGTAVYDPCCDFNRDGVIDLNDLNIIATYLGADVSQLVPCALPVGMPQIAADDFLCSDKRPITDIHWWGSYVDYQGTAAPNYAPDRFHIGIWTDVPAGADQPWSHPGVMIWQWIVPRSELNERYVGCDFYPVNMLAPDSCFRYDFIIPESEWFYQEAPDTIYWISIAAIYPGPPPTANPWGVKTREHFFNDDAVRIFMPTDPIPGSIFEVGQPIEDEAGNSWDMAFELTTRDCVKITAPFYNDWVGAGKPWSKPDCWCYQRQCRGDCDGKKVGLFWVQGDDLAIFGAAFSKGDAKLTQTTICGDLDHKKVGLFRCQGDDLAIFGAYFSKGEAKVPVCPMDWDGDTDIDYNFWMSP